MVRVMAVGVFDLLHAGHLHYVEQAKSLGDELIVVAVSYTHLTLPTICSV